MTSVQLPYSADADASIERLLVTAEPVSIVDGLLQLGGDSVDGSTDGWTRLVANRLQARLAERIRQALARHEA
jgi:hypothetical protein